MGPTGTPSPEELRSWRVELDTLNVNWNISQYSMQSSRSGWMATVITLYKQFLERLLRPVSNVIVFKQAHLNANLVNLMNIVDRRLSALERRMESLQSVSARLEESQSRIEETIACQMQNQLQETKNQLYQVAEEFRIRLEQVSQTQQQQSEMQEAFRSEIRAQISALVDEIARQLEQESRLRSTLRRQLLQEFQGEIQRLEQQLSETMVTLSLGDNGNEDEYWRSWDSTGHEERAGSE